MSVWVCTLSIIFRILVNGTYLIFPVIIEHCSISRSFHTLYIKLWHGISRNIKSQYGVPKLLSHVWVCSHILRIKIIRKSHQMPSNRNFMYIYIFLHTNEIVGISIAYEDLIFISRQISCCEMGWSFLRVGRYI